MKKGLSLASFLLSIALLSGVLAAGTTFPLYQYPGYPSGTDNFAFYQDPNPVNSAVTTQDNMEIYNNELYYRYTSEFASSTDIYKFNPSSSTWSYLTDAPRSDGSSGSVGDITLIQPSFTFYNNKLYVSSNDWVNGPLYRYDTNGQNKQQVSGFNSKAGKMIVYNNKLYLGSGTLQTLGGSNGLTEGFYEYDETNFVHKLPESGFQVEDFEIFNGNLYIAGYVRTSTTNGIIKPALYKYDGTTLIKISSDIDSSGTRRTVRDIAVIDNVLYVITSGVGRFYAGEYYYGGGTDSYGYPIPGSDGKIYTFNPSDNSFSSVSLTGVLGSPSITSIAKYNGKMHISTGYSSTGNYAPRLYVQSGSQWVELINRAGTTESHLTIQGVYNNLMYFVNNYGVIFVYNACNPNTCSAAPPASGKTLTNAVWKDSNGNAITQSSLSALSRMSIQESGYDGTNILFEVYNEKSPNSIGSGSAPASSGIAQTAPAIMSQTAGQAKPGDKVYFIAKPSAAGDTTSVRSNSIDITPTTACSSPAQTIFSFYSASNSHVSSPTDAQAPFKICYDEFFTGTPPANPTVCKQDGSNRVLSTGPALNTNAHAGDPKIASNTNYLCYGDLSCKLSAAQGVCGAGEVTLGTLTYTSNAHFSSSNTPSATYPYRLCCTTGGAPAITDVQWLKEDNSLITSSQGTPFPFTQDTTKVKVKVITTGLVGQVVSVSLNEQDTSVLDPVDDNLQKTLQGTIGSDGTVTLEWTMSNAEITKAFGGLVGEEKLVTDIFEFYAHAVVGSQSKDSILLNAKQGAVAATGWICAIDRGKSETYRRQATRTNTDGSKTTIKTLFDATTDKKLAGEACDKENAGYDGVCCPSSSGYYCTSEGCKITLQTCQQYTKLGQTSCNGAPEAAAYNENRQVGGTFGCGIQSNNQCISVPCKCEWDSNICKVHAGAQVKSTIGACSQDTGVPEVKSTCLYTSNYDSVTCDTDKDTDKGLKTIKITAKPGTGTPLDPKCIDRDITVPCGRPVIDLPFFSAWQIIGAILVIAVLYGVMFQSAALRKWLHVK